MKSIARSPVWWPKIDQEIEKVTRECQPCNKTRKAPPASPLLPWSWPTGPWQRIQVDFATNQAKHYVIMVDAHSKWPEVIGPTKRKTADSTINVMRNIFAGYGLPTQVVSDNGPPFQSAEYEVFLWQNGIQRILVSPYHPPSNELAERFMQTFSYAVGSSADNPARCMQRRIQKYTTRYYRLISYQAILTARTSHSIVSVYTWYWVSRAQPARQNEVQSRQGCPIQRDICGRPRSRTWPPIGTEVASWYCRTANITCFLSSPAERWTELEETPLVLLWLNPAL